MISFTGQASNMYIVEIAVMIYLLMVKNTVINTWLEILLHIGPWTFGILFAVVPLFGLDDFQYTLAGALAQNLELSALFTTVLLNVCCIW